MGYTTDLVVGVWAGNTDNHPTRGIDGVQSAAPIWHDFMVAAHSDPRFAETLAGPDGQPIPPDFPRPPGIFEGPVCAATGKRPTPGSRTINEVLVRGEEPALPCNRTTPEEAADLRAAMADASPNRSTTRSWCQTLDGYTATVVVGSKGGGTSRNPSGLNLGCDDVRQSMWSRGYPPVPHPRPAARSTEHRSRGVPIPP